MKIESVWSIIWPSAIFWSHAECLEPLSTLLEMRELAAILCSATELQRRAAGKSNDAYSPGFKPLMTLAVPDQNSLPHA